MILLQLGSPSVNQSLYFGFKIPLCHLAGFRVMTGDMREMFKKNIPVQRPGRRVDIADICLFIVSRGGELLTGSTVVGDGGSWLTDDNSIMRLNMVKAML